MNKIIAIVGMCGAGKSLAVDYLVSLGYSRVYFGGLTFEEMKKQNISINPENEKKMQKNLRDRLGMGAYAILSLPHIEEAVSQGNNVVIDGLYSWDELLVLENNFGKNIEVIAVIADKNIRYERLSSREVRPYSSKEAQSRDVFEIENTAKGGPIAFADYYVLNNGTEQELIDRLNGILMQIDTDKPRERTIN